MENNSNEPNIQSRLLKNSFWLYAFAIANAPMQYIIRLITSNDLTPEQIGIITSIMGIMTLFGVYVDLGMRESLNYYIPKFLHQGNKDKITTLVWLSLIIQTIVGIIIASVLWIWSDNIANIYRHLDIGYVIKIFAISLLISNLFAWLDGLFLVVQDVIYNKGLEFLRYIINIILILYIYASQFDDKLFSYSIYPLVGGIIGIIVSIFVIYKKYKHVFFAGKFDLSQIEYRKIQKYSFGVLFAINLSVILGQLDVQFALKFVSAAGAGFYANGMTIISGLLAIIVVICSIVYPMISELDAKKDHHKTNILTGILLKYISLVSGMLGIFIYYFGEYMCVMLFGEKYAVSGEMLKYIALFLPFGGLINVVYSILAGKGNTQNRVISMIGGLMVMVISSFLTTNIFGMGINGIGLSLGITRFVLFLLGYRGLKKLGIEHTRDRGFIITNILTSFSYCLIISYFYQFDTVGRGFIFWQLAAIFSGYCFVLGLLNYNTFKNLLQEFNIIKK